MKMNELFIIIIIIYSYLCNYPLSNFFDNQVYKYKSQFHYRDSLYIVLYCYYMNYCLLKRIIKHRDWFVYEIIYVHCRKIRSFEEKRNVFMSSTEFSRLAASHCIIQSLQLCTDVNAGVEMRTCFPNCINKKVMYFSYRRPVDLL